MLLALAKDQSLRISSIRTVLRKYRRENRRVRAKVKNPTYNRCPESRNSGTDRIHHTDEITFSSPGAIPGPRTRQKTHKSGLYRNSCQSAEKLDFAIAAKIYFRRTTKAHFFFSRDHQNELEFKRNLGPPPCTPSSIGTTPLHFSLPCFIVLYNPE